MVEVTRNDVNDYTTKADNLGVGNLSPIAIVSKSISDLQKPWDMTCALMDGTYAMRAAKEKFLPKWPGENYSDYENRVKVATLFPAYSQTVSSLVGKPFSKKMKLSDDMSPAIKKYTENIDREGRNLDTFCADVMSENLAHGVCGILVDFSDRPKDLPNTQAAEAEAGLRPYWLKLCFWDILGYKQIIVKGRRVLKQLRFFEYVEDAIDEYNTKIVKQIRLLDAEKKIWQIWRNSEQQPNIWTIYKFGDYTLDVVTFVPTYGEYVDFMNGCPPLLQLAFLNVKHWQSQSDQDNIVHVMRCPILVWESDDPNASLKISPNMGLKAPIGSAFGAKYVEHTGAAVTCARAELDELKDEMRQAGAQLLVMRMTQATATEIGSDESVGLSSLQRIVLMFQDGINLALEYTALWMKDNSPGTVVIYNEFGVQSLDDATAQLLPTLADDTAGKLPILSRERVYEEMQNAGRIKADIPWSVELARINGQAKPEIQPVVAPVGKPTPAPTPKPAAK